jgi:hypothetical protein
MTYIPEVPSSKIGYVSSLLSSDPIGRRQDGTSKYITITYLFAIHNYLPISLLLKLCHNPPPTTNQFRGILYICMPLAECNYLPREG